MRVGLLVRLSSTRLVKDALSDLTSFLVQRITIRPMLGVFVDGILWRYRRDWRG